MKSHRVAWTIAGVAVALALMAFLLREAAEHLTESPLGNRREERDRLVAEMLSRLEMDHRMRFAETRAVVDAAAKYCDEPALATAETWYAMGLRRYYGAFDMKGAEEAFLRASRMRPRWAWPVNGLGIVQFVAGRREEALASFGRALKLDPGWSRPHSDMAILYRRAGELHKAMAEAESALSLEPEHPVNLFNYGVILDDLGRHEEARAQYLRVIEIAPELPQAAYNLACSFAREGDAARAVEWLSRAIDALPEFRSDARSDEDFDRVRGDSSFVALVAEDAGNAAP